MTDKKQERVYADRVQTAYANALDIVSHSVIVVMVLGYLLYLTELPPLSVPIETIAGNWHLSSARMQAKLHLPCGWSCFSSSAGLMHGDVVSYMSIIFLSMATVLCLATAIMAFFREKNHLYSSIATVQIVVLLIAASGILSAGK
jgi:uncharacterized membrane protein